MLYFLWIDEKQQGPYQRRQVLDALLSGSITKQTLCCAEGASDWNPVSAIPDLLDEVSPPPLPPILVAPAVPEPVWFGCEASRVAVRSSSGALIEIKEIQLYDEQELREIGVEKARATELLGGSDSPFGFIGGAFWVISNMLAQDYIVRTQSDKMAKEGFALIEGLAKREQKLRSIQTFFHVGRIENIDYPSPSLWRVMVPGRTFGYIHSGDDFVTVRDTSDKIHSLRWSAIEQYSYEANA